MMTEFIKQLSSNLVERFIIAAVAAVLTTYIITQRQEGRIAVLERDSKELREHEKDDSVRFNRIEQRLVRCEAIIEIQGANK